MRCKNPCFYFPHRVQHGNLHLTGEEFLGMIPSLVRLDQLSIDRWRRSLQIKARLRTPGPSASKKLSENSKESKPRQSRSRAHRFFGNDDIDLTFTCYAKNHFGPHPDLDIVESTCLRASRLRHAAAFCILGLKIAKLRPASRRSYHLSLVCAHTMIRVHLQSAPMV